MLAILPAVFVGLLVTAVLITWFCRKRQAKSQHKTVIVRTPIVAEHHGITTTAIPTEQHEITFTPIPTGQHSYYDGVDYSKFDHSPRLTSEIQDVGEYAIPDELNMSCSAVEEHDDNSHCLDSTDYDGYLNPYQALTGQREDNSSHTYESTNQQTEYANTGIDTSCDLIDKDHDNTYEQLEEDRSNDHHGYAPIRLNN